MVNRKILCSCRKDQTIQKAIFQRSGDKDTFILEVDEVTFLVRETEFGGFPPRLWTAYATRGKGVTYVNKDLSISPRP